MKDRKLLKKKKPARKISLRAVRLQEVKFTTSSKEIIIRQFQFPLSNKSSQSVEARPASLRLRERRKVRLGFADVAQHLIAQRFRPGEFFFIPQPLPETHFHRAAR